MALSLTSVACHTFFVPVTTLKVKTVTWGKTFLFGGYCKQLNGYTHADR
ncbi:hypothetical protein [Moorena sp. SIO3H5]|nr:hypothetical protein [Moorena sp. SIO3H5]NEO68269.1 hypothetical protein [Moorena sp. SIO3H5]